MEYKCADKIKDEMDFEYDHPEIVGMSVQEMHEHYSLTFFDDTKGARRSSNLADIVSSN